MPGWALTGTRLPGEAGGVHMGSALQHDGVAGQQLPRPDQELVAHRDRFGRDVVHARRPPIRWAIRGAAASSSRTASEARPWAYRSRASPPVCISTTMSPASGSRSSRAATMASMATRSAAKRPATDAAEGAARPPAHR